MNQVLFTKENKQKARKQQRPDKMSLPSRGVMLNLMDRMKTVNYEITGNRWKDEDEDLEGMSPFDAQKYLLAKKLGLIRERILQRDDALKTKKGGVKRSARLSNEIKKMIKIVKMDYEKLQHLHEKSAKKKKFTRKKPDPARIQKQLDDLNLIKQHLDEIEILDKRRHKKDDSSGKKKNLTDEELGGEDDLAAKIMMATALPDDPTKSNLPVIDISSQMQQVAALNKKIDEQADILGEKLTKLKAIAQDIGDELDTQKVMLQSLEDKVEKEIERLKALNKRVDTALDKIGGSMKLMCIVAIIVIFVVMAGIAAIFVISYFK